MPRQVPLELTLGVGEDAARGLEAVVNISGSASEVTSSHSCQCGHLYMIGGDLFTETFSKMDIELLKTAEMKYFRVENICLMSVL